MTTSSAVPAMVASEADAADACELDTTVAIIVQASTSLGAATIVGATVLCLAALNVLCGSDRHTPHRTPTAVTVLHLLFAIGLSDLLLGILWISDVFRDRCAFASTVNYFSSAQCDRSSFTLDYVLSFALDYSLMQNSLWTAALAHHLCVSLVRQHSWSVGSRAYYSFFAAVVVCPAVVLAVLAVLVWHACSVPVLVLVNTCRLGVPLLTLLFCAHQYYQIRLSFASHEQLLTSRPSVTSRLVWRLSMYILAYGVCQLPSLVCNALALVSPALGRHTLLIGIDFLTLPLIGVADALVFLHHALRALPNDPHPNLGLATCHCCDGFRRLPKSFIHGVGSFAGFSTGGFEPEGTSGMVDQTSGNEHSNPILAFLARSSSLLRSSLRSHTRPPSLSSPSRSACDGAALAQGTGVDAQYERV